MLNLTTGIDHRFRYRMKDTQGPSGENQQREHELMRMVCGVLSVNGGSRGLGGCEK